MRPRRAALLVCVFSDGRDVGFENSVLSLGGRCTYPVKDGSVVITREPGWRFTGAIAGIVAALASLVAYLARRKGYPGWLFGLCAFVAPPLVFLLAVTARRKMRAGRSFC